MSYMPKPEACQMRSAGCCPPLPPSVVREAVFRVRHIPVWVTPVGYTAFAVIGTIFIPFIYHPGEQRRTLTRAHRTPPLLTLGAT